MRETMPEQDITLGEVYRAVLSLREDVQQTRTEIHAGQTALSNEVTENALKMKELEVNIRHITERVVTLETIKLNVMERRVQQLETEPKQSADPLARIFGAIGAAILGGIMYWLNKGG